jgi:radical SAM PhpK family P-methyltransferase
MSMSMNKNSRLDCIVVGHNDVDFSMVEQALVKTQNHSGAYLDLKANSVRYRGRRMTYMSLLNEVLTDVSGRASDLHECEVPNLGAAYLASFLRRRGCEVEVINFFNKDKGRLATLLEDASPGAVAITTTLYVDHTPISEVVRFVREHNPDTKVIVGGPHVFNICSTQEPQTQDFIFQMIGADIYIFDSQGELTLSQILEQLRADGDLSRIPNLVYTADGRTFARTGRSVESNDMNANVVDWQLFDRQYYTPTVQTRTARSCAFNCSFCRYPVNAGPLNLTGLDVLENELRYLKAMGVKNVVFIDDTFNVPLPRFKNICRMLIRNKFEFDWYSFFRASNSDDEAIDLMVESGCKGVFLGIESGDPTTLTYMNKHADVGKYAHAIRRFNETGITSFASIIIGFPGETEETFQNTMDFLESSPPTFYRGEMYYHYTNVPIHDRATEFGFHGAGYSWKHKTMDWRRAAELLQHMYSTLSGPCVLPGYMFDFWAIPYLTGKGFRVEQIKDFTRIAQGMLVRSFEDPSPDFALEEAGLRAIFQAV